MLPPEDMEPGKRAGARRSRDLRANCLTILHNITSVPPDSPLWFMLELTVGKIPALVDTGAQLSCILSDVVEYLYFTEEPCKYLQCAVS